MIYRVLTEADKPGNSVVVADHRQLPVLDHQRFNLASTIFALPPAAQAYFDQLDLTRVAAEAPDRWNFGTKFKIPIFKLTSFEEGQAFATIRRNFPANALRDDFVKAMVEVAKVQSHYLGASTSFICVLNLPGQKGILHHDNQTFWRSLWQPVTTSQPALTTIVADDALAHSRPEYNNYGSPAETAPQLLHVAANNSLLFWTGELTPLPRIHAEPNIPAEGAPRLTLIAQNKL